VGDFFSNFVVFSEYLNFNSYFSQNNERLSNFQGLFSV